MIIALALALAVQLAGVESVAPTPRFTMRADPGDAVTGRLFRLTSDDRRAEVDRIFAGEGEAADVAHDAVGPMVIAYRRGGAPGDDIVLYAATGSEGAQDKACRLTRDRDAKVDNSDRALRWCLSFLDRSMTPTIILPPSRLPGLR